MRVIIRQQESGLVFGHLLRMGFLAFTGRDSTISSSIRDTEPSVGPCPWEAPPAWQKSFNVFNRNASNLCFFGLLIVEDNASVRRLLRRAVQQIATEIWECGNGAEALAVYSEQLPNVVLMDVRMPTMDGLTATGQIRKFDPAARIIIATDCDDEDMRAAASKAGASGYVLKQDLTRLEALIGKSYEI
jgi:CheY-like chemotaxis protein